MVSFFGHSKENHHKENDKTDTKRSKSATVKTSSNDDIPETEEDTDEQIIDEEAEKIERSKQMKKASASKKPKNGLQANGNHMDEDETKVNTRLNALLYHTNDETVDMYKSENNSSDLLGRLYYDDFDSGSMTPQSVSDMGMYASPARSPSNTSVHREPGPGTLLPSNSYINWKLNQSSMPGSAPNATPYSASNHKPPLQKFHSFERGVSFDTSTNYNRKSLTFKVKHPDFKFRRNNKTFLAGFNGGSDSFKAIEWIFGEVIMHGDTIIVLQVLDEKYNNAIDKRVANENLSKIELLNTHIKKVSLVYEVVIGKPQKLLKSAIDEYNPSSMIIGTHHVDDRIRSGSSHYKLFQKASFSKHFLQCALVPVIVVKPTHHYYDKLEIPIEGEDYFKKWIESIDIKHTYIKEKGKKKNRITSPPLSRSSSYLSIPTSLSAQTLPIEAGGSLPEKNAKHEDRGRPSEVRDHDLKSKFTIGSRSRSRSQTRSQPQQRPPLQSSSSQQRSQSRSQSRPPSSAKPKRLVNLFANH